MKLLPKIIIFGFGVLAFLPFLAPVFMHFGLTGPAEFIYTIFVPFCHQKASRSLHLFDYQVAFCARDTFIYFTLFLASIFSYVFRLKTIKIKYLILFSIPIALDGGIQIVTQIIALQAGHPTDYLESTNLRRMITGALFGSAVGFFIFPMLFQDVFESLKKEKNLAELKFKGILLKVSKLSTWKFIFINLAISFLFYLVLSLAWFFTSDVYKPSGIIDNEHRIPGLNYEIEGRGDHAAFLFGNK
ncbi:DUF2085 domain-containing protein [Candidatus Dojkabacteria bacterium]|uniref:DUF2085 domain-containing protein n=1 Tax=Candidatus Dojkabacteria bacterium TaxID=2099670 RepID=A0A955L3Y3_9BACT|nr:DUF2085 domain-containing protein [Candidatus Dojkabacteria bacterium]